MPRQRAIVLVCAVLVAASLGNGCSDDHSYRAEVNIDTVIVANRVIMGSSALVKFTIPGGCNRLPSAEIISRSDTLHCRVTLEFYDPGMPCVHGPVPDSLPVEIHPAQWGDYKLVYRRTGSTYVTLPVKVVDPI